MKTLVILNPAAGGGRAARKLRHMEKALREALGEYEVGETSPEGSLPPISNATVRVIAAGGDGTVNAVANMLAEMSASPALGVLPLGTGNDFARGLGMHGLPQALAALREGRLRPLDLGQARFSRADGTRASHWFANVASVGLIGEVVAAAQASPLKRLLGSKLAYPLHAVQVLRRYAGHEIEVELDDGTVRRAHVLAAAIANGPFFGAGMKVAPHALHDDGLLDVLIAASTPKFRARDLRLLYSGRHFEHAAISAFKARRVRLAATDGSTLLCETDGELQGTGPVEFTAAPAKITVFAT